MFRKQVDKKVIPSDSKPEPVVAEEIIAPSESDEIVEESENEQLSEGSEEELTEEQVKNILQKLASDVQAIKYHLRLDFI